MRKVMAVVAGVMVSLPAFAVVEVPEPGSLGLLALGLAGVVAARLRRK